MGFIDEALYKTKEVFDVTVKKTEKTFNVEKLKIKVSSVKSKMEKDYAELGKTYYTALKKSASVPENFADLVESIDKKAEELKDLKQQIAEETDKKVCPDCGAYVTKESVFCNVCGTKIV